MNRKTTPSPLKTKKTNSPDIYTFPGPQKKTLELIRQVAHNYYAEPGLPDGLQGMLMS